MTDGHRDNEVGVDVLRNVRLVLIVPLQMMLGGRVMRAAGTAAPQKPRAECFILCDFAQVVNGKFNLLGGGWDHVNPSQLPITHRGYLAIRLVLPWSYAGRPVLLRLDLTLPNGERDEPLNLRMEVSPPAGGIEEQGIPLLIPLDIQLTLTLVGLYAFALAIDGEPVAETWFRVIEPAVVVGEPGPEEEFDPPLSGPDDERLMRAKSSS